MSSIDHRRRWRAGPLAILICTAAAAADAQRWRDRWNWQPEPRPAAAAPARRPEESASQATRRTSFNDSEPGHLGVAVLPAEGESDSGMLVVEVEAGSPAERVGLKVGDRLLAVDAHFVGSYEALVTQLRHSAETGGGEANLLWHRGYETFSCLTESLAAAPPAKAEGRRLQATGTKNEETKTVRRVARDALSEDDDPPEAITIDGGGLAALALCAVILVFTFRRWRKR